MGVASWQPFELPERIGEGERNETLYKYGSSLRAKGADDDSVSAALLAANDGRCAPPLARREVAAIARSVCSKAPGRSPEFERALEARAPRAGTPDADRIAFNDKELSRLFADMHRDRLCYVPEARCWYAFDGVRWVDDRAGGELIAQKVMKKFIDQICVAAARVEGDEERGKAMKGASRYNQQNARERLLKDCKSEMMTPIAEFDADRMLFNCRNCTLDLRTMEARPHDPADMLTKVAGCGYDPDASYAGWSAFLAETFGGNWEICAFLQRRVGRALAADTSNEQFTIAYGQTRTGKSTALDTILAMFGDYGATAQPETFQEIRRNSRAASGDVARLAGVRLLECPEPPKGMMLDVALIKQMTGGDLITARKLNQGEFQFRPGFHLVMNTNYLPEVRDQTLFESGRVVVVPFNNRCAEGERDAGLKERLREQACLSGVLNWALDGLRIVRAFGDPVPEACRKATGEYATDSDRIGAFIADECETGDGLRGVGARLFERYLEWTDSQGYKSLTRSGFYKELKRRDGIRYIEKTTVDGRTSRNVFAGIRPNDAIHQR